MSQFFIFFFFKKKNIRLIYVPQKKESHTHTTSYKFANVPKQFLEQDVDQCNVTNEGQQKIFRRQQCSFRLLPWSQCAPPPQMTDTLERTHMLARLEGFDVYDGKH